METIHERLKILIPALGFSSLDKFDIALGRARSTTKNITGSRKTKPGYDYLNSILALFPKVDANWLFKGKGEMFFPEQPKRDYIEILEKELEDERRKSRRYEAALDIVAQRNQVNFQRLSKKTPAREIVVIFDRKLSKIA
jgi:hypothetical protein